jgi:CRISPR-associated protein Csm4
MPEFSLYFLKPNAPFHLGERGIGLEETSTMAHSDTLFGAICWAWKLLYGEEDLIELLKQYHHAKPPFLISSTFPFIDKILLLPKPLDGLGPAGLEKDIRKASLVSVAIFQSLAQGKKLPSHEIFPGDPGGVIITPEEATIIRKLIGSNPAWTLNEAPRVTLDRDTRQSEIYYAGDLRFMKDCGLYMLVNFLDKSYITKLEGALRLLGDEGLGGERSSGRGFFTLDKDSISLGSDDGNKAVLLSLYRPTQEETNDLVRSSYSLVPRRGWVAGKSDKRKKSLRMLAEGSVIPFSPGKVKGSFVNVGTGEEKKICSYGLAFQAPVRMTL